DRSWRTISGLLPGEPPCFGKLGIVRDARPSFFYDSRRFRRREMPIVLAHRSEEKPHGGTRSNVSEADSLFLARSIIEELTNFPQPSRQQRPYGSRFDVQDFGDFTVFQPFSPKSE